MRTHECDVAVVGSGPNGLTAAAYLTRAGARVVMLEKRFERGGTLATDDYSTPFQYNLAQFELPLADELPPYRDLELHSQGVRFVRPEIVFASKTRPDDEEFTVGRGGRGLGTEIEEMFAATSAVVSPLLYRGPTSEDQLRAGLPGTGHEVVLRSRTRRRGRSPSAPLTTAPGSCSATPAGLPASSMAICHSG